MSEVNPDKPCPFCGNPTVQTTVDDGCHWSSCPKCSATGPTEFLRSDEDSPGWNTRPDFDRVTAERDAALETVALKNRDALEAQTAVTGWARKYDALQQRLTASDERVDVLEGQLAESERKRLEFVDAVKVETDLIEANHSSCVMVPEGYAVVPIKPTKAMRDACQIAGKLPVWDAMMAAALKTAEGGGDEA